MFHKEMLKDFQSTLKSRTLATAYSFLAQRMACVFPHRRGNIAPDALDLRDLTHTYLLNARKSFYSYRWRRVTYQRSRCFSSKSMKKIV